MIEYIGCGRVKYINNYYIVIIKVILMVVRMELTKYCENCPDCMIEHESATQYEYESDYPCE